jgi:putative addiction module component (TIGR02574 family)
MSVALLQDALLNLPASERARLLDVLWDSLSEPEVQAREAAWAGESERRVAAYERGALPARSAEAVFADLERKLPK